MGDADILIHNGGLPFSYLEPHQLITPPRSPAQGNVAELCSGNTSSSNCASNQSQQSEHLVTPVSLKDSPPNCVSKTRPSISRWGLPMASYRRSTIENQFSCLTAASVTPVSGLAPIQASKACKPLRDFVSGTTMRHGNSQRLKIATELLLSEQRYVDSLFMLQNTFIEPLMTSSSGALAPLSSSSMSAIFANFVDILHISAELLALLQDRLDPFDEGVGISWNSETDSISDIFCLIGHYFKMYKTYCRNFNSASVVLNHEIVHNYAFNKFLSQSHISDALAGLSLQSYLLLPVQRVPRYRLLLSELMGCTPHEHHDYSATIEALSIVSEVALGINEAVRQQENWQTLLDLEACFLNLDEPLTNTPSRVLLKQGSITKVCRKTHQVRELFLFNDCLVMATLIRPSNILNTIQKHYLFNRRFPLTTLRLDLPTNTTYHDDGHKFFWRLISPTKSFLAYGTSCEDRTSWIESVTKAQMSLVAISSVQRMAAIENPTMHIKRSKGRIPNGFAGISSLAASLLYPVSNNDDYPILRDLSAPIWVENSTTSSCQRCHALFSLLRGRHHCRICGWLVCAGCSGKRFLTSSRSEALRSCSKCYTDKFNNQTTTIGPTNLTMTSSLLVDLDVPPLNMETFRRSTQRTKALRERRRSLMLQVWKA